MIGWWYRLRMRVVHDGAFGHWHYMPVIGPLEPGGGFQRWCKWCGLRHCWDIDPRHKQIDDEYRNHGWFWIGDWFKRPSGATEQHGKEYFCRKGKR